MTLPPLRAAPEVSVVVNGRTKIYVESEKVENVVDTTGAGDLYAAGFLYGLTQGRSLGTCAMIGSIAAAEIISHYGARPEISLRGSGSQQIAFLRQTGLIKKLLFPKSSFLLTHKNASLIIRTIQHKT
ncbi:MAG: PfkB family carbohydrate kinase [Alphaproteobacteria bacterium]